MNELLVTCLLAGRLMVEGGAEMYRVDDTMRRIIQNGGGGHAIVFTTTTGLFVGIDDAPLVKLTEVTKRAIDMEKVTRVNDLSRAFANGELTLEELHAALIEVDHHTPFFPVSWQLLAAAICSATLMVLFAQSDDWGDMPLAAVAGALGYYAYSWLGHLTRVRFISELLGGFTAGVVAWLGVRLGLGHNLDNLIVGAVMPLVPGVAITNSIRDMLAGHLLSGIARGLEAVLSVSAIGVGIAVIFRFF